MNNALSFFSVLVILMICFVSSEFEYDHETKLGDFFRCVNVNNTRMIVDQIRLIYVYNGFFRIQIQPPMRMSFSAFCYWNSFLKMTGCIFTDVYLYDLTKSNHHIINANTIRGFIHTFRIRDNMLPNDPDDVEVINRESIHYDKNIGLTSHYFGKLKTIETGEKVMSTYPFENDIKETFKTLLNLREIREQLDEGYSVFSEYDYSLIFNLVKDTNSKRSLIISYLSKNSDGLYLKTDSGIMEFWKTNYTTSKLMAYYEYNYKYCWRWSVFASPLKNLNCIKGFHGGNNTLITISDLRMHLTYFKFTDRSRDAFARAKIVDIISYSIPMVEFFNCNVKIERPDIVKGILFVNQVYYIFINRYYLIIEEDLIALNFKLEDRHYKSAVFYNEDLQQQVISINPSTNVTLIEYEMVGSKWIHRVNNKFYLRLFIFEFEIHVLPNKKLDFRLLVHSKRLIFPSCPWQLLNTQTHIYCFTPKQYYLAYTYVEKKFFDIFTSEGISHSEFFENVPNNEIHEDLQIIVDYNESSFIFMTTNYFFIIPYISIVNEPKAKLVHTPGFQIFKNKLFNQNEVRGLQFAEYIFFYITFIFFLLIIIVLTLGFSLINKLYQNRMAKRESKRNKVNLSYRDMERKKRYRKLFEGFDFISRSFFLNGSNSKSSRSSSPIKILNSQSKSSRFNSTPLIFKINHKEIVKKIQPYSQELKKLIGSEIYKNRSR